jgi:hypothetical protein
MGGFLGSAVVSTASVGVPPTESSIHPFSEMHGRPRRADRENGALPFGTLRVVNGTAWLLFGRDVAA